jgi:hypothetical protein
MEKTMFQSMSYQLYSAADQRVCDLRSGEIAAAVRDLRLRLGRAFRPRHRGRKPARRPLCPEATEVALRHPMARAGILELTALWPFDEN